MKNKIIYTIIVTLGLGLTQTSCSKYEDGPAISFRSSTARLTNHWKFSKVTFNSNDISSKFSGYEWEIMEDGTFKEYVNSIQTQSGTWILDGTLILKYSDGNLDRFNVKRLTKNEMTVYLLDIGPYIELTSK